MGAEAEVVGGGTPKTHRADSFGGDISWITPADLSGYKQKYISAGARSITKAGLDNSGAKLMPAGTVLFSSRAPIGYVAIAANPVSTNQGFKSFVLKDSLTPDFAYYYLQHAKKLALELASGTTFQEISGKNAARLPVPVPPLPDQRQIVAEIEKQFTRLDAGVAALRRVQANLKRYRAAVLKAACEGRLVPTEAELAKAEGRSYETGEQLLARILADRRRHWQGRGKYKEPAALDTTNLPPLPESWAWASLDQMAWASAYGTSARCSYDGAGPPVLRIPNIVAGRIDVSDLKFATTNLSMDTGDELMPGDLLVIRTNGSRDLIGRSAVVRTQFENVVGYASYLIRFRLWKSSTLFDWVGSIWNVSFLREWIEQRAATSAGQHNISMSVLSAMPIPLPPLVEQARIVAEVERRLSVIKELEAAITANLQRATRLRKSVLQQAFTAW